MADNNDLSLVSTDDLVGELTRRCDVLVIGMKRNGIAGEGTYFFSRALPWGCT